MNVLLLVYMNSVHKGIERDEDTIIISDLKTKYGFGSLDLSIFVSLTYLPVLSTHLGHTSCIFGWIFIIYDDISDYMKKKKHRYGTDLKKNSRFQALVFYLHIPLTIWCKDRKYKWIY